MNPFNVKKGILIPTSMLSLLSGENHWNELRKNIMRELSNVKSFAELVEKLEEANSAVDILIYDMNLLVPVQKPLKEVDTGEAKFNLKKVMLGEDTIGFIGESSVNIESKRNLELNMQHFQNEKSENDLKELKQLQDAILGAAGTGKSASMPSSEPSGNCKVPTDEMYQAQVRLFIKKGVFNYYYHPEYFIGSVQTQKSKENQFALFHKKLGQLTTWGTTEALMKDIIEEGVTFN